MAAMEEIPRYEKHEKTRKRAKSNSKLGKPKKNRCLNQLQNSLPNINEDP
jgi:hypothetical protein